MNILKPYRLPVMPAILVMLIVGSWPVGVLQARPAPWYWWQSQTSDASVCSQTSPGPAWTRGNTAFRDARCEQPLQNPPPS